MYNWNNYKSGLTIYPVTTGKVTVHDGGSLIVGADFVQEGDLTSSGSISVTGSMTASPDSHTVYSGSSVNIVRGSYGNLTLEDGTFSFDEGEYTFLQTVQINGVVTLTGSETAITAITKPETG